MLKRLELCEKQNKIYSVGSNFFVIFNGVNFNMPKNTLSFLAGPYIVLRVKTEVFVFEAGVFIPPAAMCVFRRAIRQGMIFTTFQTMTVGILLTSLHTSATSSNISTIVGVKVPVFSLREVIPITLVMCTFKFISEQRRNPITIYVVFNC